MVTRADYRLGGIWSRIRNAANEPGCRIVRSKIRIDLNFDLVPMTSPRVTIMSLVKLLVRLSAREEGDAGRSHKVALVRSIDKHFSTDDPAVIKTEVGDRSTLERYAVRLVDAAFNDFHPCFHGHVLEDLLGHLGLEDTSQFRGRIEGRSALPFLRVLVPFLVNPCGVVLVMSIDPAIEFTGKAT